MQKTPVPERKETKNQSPGSEMYYNTLLYSKKDSHNYKQLLLLFPACNYLPEQQCLRKPRENAAEMVKDLKGELTVQKTWGR